MSANRNREEFGPITRNRSSSANEASKPIVMIHRRPTQLGNKPSNFSPTNGSNGGKFHFDLLQYLHTFSVFVFCFVFFLYSTFLLYQSLWANWVLFNVFFFSIVKLFSFVVETFLCYRVYVELTRFFLLFFETGRLIFYFFLNTITRTLTFTYTKYIYMHKK